MGVEGSATSSFGEYEFKALSSVVDGGYCGWLRSGYGRVRQCGSGDWKRV